MLREALGWPRHAAHRSAVVLAAGFVGADQSGFPERRATCHAMGRQHHQVRKQSSQGFNWDELAGDRERWQSHEDDFSNA